MQPSTQKPSAIVKPTTNTKFHIDYSWWETGGEDLRTYILSQLLPEQREQLANSSEERVMDYIDPDTGEVFQVDELGLAVQIAAKAPDFINPQIALIDSIFRVFLANDNTPLSPNELSQLLPWKPSRTILATLGGRQIYLGIRPVWK